MAGPAASIAVELAGRADPSSVLASQTVKDLSIGLDLDFERGRDFRPVSVAETWRTYRVRAPARSMTLEAWQRRWEAPGEGRPTPAGRRRLLTRREREVLDLLVAGRSDGEIAAQLFISKKTASVHVSNIKGKLGSRSRVETVVLALRRGLVDP
jgi:DNA-binding CsgD family transcriptional regulator